MRRSFAWGAVFGLGWMPRAAAAQGSSVELDYAVSSGLSGCPTRAGLLAMVVQRLGSSRSAVGSRSFEVRLGPSEQGLTAQVRERDARGITGARTVVSRTGDCIELAETVATALALAVDPTSFSSPPESTSAQDVARSSLADASPPRRLTLEWALGTRVSWGLLPSAQLVPELMASLRFGAASLEMSALYAPPKGLDSSGTTVRARLGAVALRPCVRSDRWVACAQGLFGDLIGDSSVPRREFTFYAAAGVLVAAELPIWAAWRVRLQGDVSAVLTPTGLLLQDREVWRTPSVWSSLGMFLVGPFP